jgi:Zn-dependent alcohol dehydrogenase
VRVNDLFSASLGDGTTRLSRDGAVVYRGLGVGAFGEYVITPETGAVKVADDTPLDVACVIGCAVQTGVGSVLNTARVEEGSTVLVIGLGGVGMSVVQGARLAGAARIIVSDPIAERREVARSLGATDAIDPTATEVPVAVHGLVDGGVDYAFEVVGRSALVRDCIWSTRSGGTTVMVGAMGLDDPLVIEPAVVFASTERKLLGTLLGSSNSLREVPRLLGLWRAGRLDLEALITMRRPITEVNEAFADLRAGRGIRTVLSF